MFVDSTYDTYGRDEIETVLHRTTNEMNFYVDAFWWENLTEEKEIRYDNIMYELEVIFFESEYIIQITSVFGKKSQHTV